MWKKIKDYVYSIAIALGVSAISAFATHKSMEVYDKIIQPPLAPPTWVFPVVWTILFILMGISSAIIYKQKDENSTKALYIYGIQLVVNFFWSIIFFNLQAYLFAFIWLLFLWFMIFLTIKEFYKINKFAGILLVPYLLWVTFAGYLNFMIFWLNR